MFRKFIEFIREVRSYFRTSELEMYIRSRNPQNSADVDAIEREFYRVRQVSIFDRYY